MELGIEEIIFLSGLIGLAAVLYSSVGHGGASGYLAVMALWGLSPMMMKPTGLVLNILVSSIAMFHFYRAGRFSWPIFLPITLAAVPFAFVGGAVSLPSDFYKIIAGIVLGFASYRLFFQKGQSKVELKRMPLRYALLSGSTIGLLSGLIGVGGGIFLSPLLIFMRWSNVKETAGISAAFILVNSISGLLGHATSVQYIPSYILWFGLAAIVGGIIGAKLGSQRTSNDMIRYLLATVLLVAGVKLILISF